MKSLNESLPMKFPVLCALCARVSLWKPFAFRQFLRANHREAEQRTKNKPKSFLFLNLVTWSSDLVVLLPTSCLQCLNLKFVPTHLTAVGAPRFMLWMNGRQNCWANCRTKLWSKLWSNTIAAIVIVVGVHNMDIIFDLLKDLCVFGETSIQRTGARTGCYPCICTGFTWTHVRIAPTSTIVRSSVVWSPA